MRRNAPRSAIDVDAEEYGRRDTLIVSTQASLGSAFCPAWLGGKREALDSIRIRIVAGNLYDCLEDFLHARSDPLLCYDFPQMNPLLERNDLIRETLSTDRLVPVAPATIADDVLSGTRVACVAFPRESFFGDLIQREAAAFFEGSSTTLDHRIETAHAEGVRELVKQGLGMAWLPERLIEAELAGGQLRVLDALPTIAVEIHCLRHRQPTSPLVDRAWPALIA